MCDRCACCDAVDYGACDFFVAGMNGRCVYCDHAENCHPGTGEYYNAPVAPVKRPRNTNRKPIDIRRRK